MALLAKLEAKETYTKLRMFTILIVWCCCDFEMQNLVTEKVMNE